MASTHLTHGVGDVQVASVAEVESVQETGRLLLLSNVSILGHSGLVEVFLSRLVWKRLGCVACKEGEKGGVALRGARREEQEDGESSLHDGRSLTQLTPTTRLHLRQVTTSFTQPWGHLDTLDHSRRFQEIPGGSRGLGSWIFR